MIYVHLPSPGKVFLNMSLQPIPPRRDIPAMDISRQRNFFIWADWAATELNRLNFMDLNSPTYKFMLSAEHPIGRFRGGTSNLVLSAFDQSECAFRFHLQGVRHPHEPASSSSIPGAPWAPYCPYTAEPALGHTRRIYPLKGLIYRRALRCG